MTTIQVADKLTGLCRKGYIIEALHELYSPEIISKEMPDDNGDTIILK